MSAEICRQWVTVDEPLTPVDRNTPMGNASRNTDNDHRLMERHRGRCRHHKTEWLSSVFRGALPCMEFFDRPLTLRFIVKQMRRIILETLDYSPHSFWVDNKITLLAFCILLNQDEVVPFRQKGSPGGIWHRPFL